MQYDRISDAHLILMAGKRKDDRRYWDEVKRRGLLKRAQQFLEGGRFQPNITDRAKRYRAQKNKPAGRKLCTFCGRRKNVDVDHVTGDESDGAPENLMWLCRPCNTTKGIIQARNRIGIRTRQYNPTRRPTFDQFKQAARILLGKPGDAAKATEIIRHTPPEDRAKFAEKIAAGNPFRSEAQRRKFYAMAERGEITMRQLRHFERHNPAAFPTFAQYAHGVSIHRRSAHDEGGAIIHGTPAAARRRYAKRIAQLKKERGNPLFAPQSRIDLKKFKQGVGYGLEIDVTGRGRWEEQGLYATRKKAEAEGAKIARKEGMKYRVKVTRDVR